MKILITVLFIILSPSVFAIDAIKAISISHHANVTGARGAVSAYAFSQSKLSPYNGPSRDIHTVKVSGIMKGSDGKTSFRTLYFYVKFTSNFTYSITEASLGDFLKA